MIYKCATFQEWEESGIEQLQLPTVDLVAAPSQKNLVTGVNFINKHRKKGNSVYVHCKAGKTRSTTLVACYLMSVSYANLCYVFNSRMFVLTFHIYFLYESEKYKKLTIKVSIFFLSYWKSRLISLQKCKSLLLGYTTFFKLLFWQVKTSIYWQWLLLHLLPLF